MARLEPENGRPSRHLRGVIPVSRRAASGARQARGRRRLWLARACLPSTLQGHGTLCNPEPSCATSPGSRCPGSPSDDDVARFVEAAGAAFPKAGWEIRKRDAVSPQFTRNLERFTQLLTLVALTALVVGGAGVANAVHGLIDRKRAAFAILKALGALASRVFVIALDAGAAGGDARDWSRRASGRGHAARRGGGAAPRDRPAGERAGRPAGLGLGALYGLLVTLVFSLGPLGRAHDIPASRVVSRTTRLVLRSAGPLHYSFSAHAR